MKKLDTEQIRFIWWTPSGEPDLMERTAVELCDALDEAYAMIEKVKAVCALHRIVHVNEILGAIGEEPKGYE